MIVKKFQAPTETEAVLKARDELGSSAVVLNVKTLKQRGIFRLFRKDMVEITAAQKVQVKKAGLLLMKLQGMSLQIQTCRHRKVRQRHIHRQVTHRACQCR